MSTEITLKPIGVIHSPYKNSSGVPIQPAVADDAQGTVEVYEQYAAGLQDLDGFERIWLLYWFHRASEANLLVKPYLDTVERGLFATRAPSRPNPIGLSSVRFLGIDGNILKITEFDILDGTPLLDIKPYASKFDCFNVTRNGWLDNVKDINTKADNRFFK